MPTLWSRILGLRSLSNLCLVVAFTCHSREATAVKSKYDGYVLCLHGAFDVRHQIDKSHGWQCLERPVTSDPDPDVTVPALPAFPLMASFRPNRLWGEPIRERWWKPQRVSGCKQTLAVTLCAFICAIIIIIIIRGNELEKNAGGALEQTEHSRVLQVIRPPKRESFPLIVRTTGGSASIEYV